MDTKDFKRLEKMYSPRYLPGLDGLRAFAVIGIIIYHLNAQWLSGAFRSRYILRYFRLFNNKFVDK